MVLKDEKRGIGKLPVLCDSCVKRGTCRFEDGFRYHVNEVEANLGCLPYKPDGWKCNVFYLDPELVEGRDERAD